MTSSALNSHNLSSDSARMRALLPADEQRQALEKYIAHKYLQVHDAHITEFLPVLLSLAKSHALPDQSPLGAVGIRPGQCRPMFLEQYLDQPIEQHIARLSKSPVDRLTLVEIGNLVVNRQSFIAELLVLLATLLQRLEFKWMVFTATRQVEGLTRFLGLNPQLLAPASPERLKQAPTQWGNYYQNCPNVMVGNLDEAASIIEATPKLRKITEKHAQNLAQVSAVLSCELKSLP